MRFELARDLFSFPGKLIGKNIEHLVTSVKARVMEDSKCKKLNLNEQINIFMHLDINCTIAREK